MSVVSLPLRVCEAIADVVNRLKLTERPCAATLAPSYDVAGGDSGLLICVSPSNVNFGRRTRSESTFEVASNVVAFCKCESDADADAALNALCVIGDALNGAELVWQNNVFRVKSVALYGASVLYGSDWKGAEDDIQIDAIYNREELADANVFSSTLVVNIIGEARK